MADVINRAEFTASQVEGIVSTVKGKSALAKLTEEKPVPFNGTKVMTFSALSEAEVVGESEKKSKTDVDLKPVIVVPNKYVFGIRTSDEFLYADEEYQLSVLDDFAEAFARKIARGFDIASMHGLNPRTGTASSTIGDNNFDSKITNVLTATDSADADMESAIALVEELDGEVTGAVLSTKFRSDLGSETTNTGAKKYPDLAWGQNTGFVNGLQVEANSTVGVGGEDLAIVGDFQTGFRWGYAKDIPIEIIRYGNPDNNEVEGDLAGRNQVYLRAEAFIGHGILDPNAFAIIKKA